MEDKDWKYVKHLLEKMREEIDLIVDQTEQVIAKRKLKCDDSTKS